MKLGYDGQSNKILQGLLNTLLICSLSKWRSKLVCKKYSS